MIVDELFERTVSVTKTVWQKRGDEISRHDVKRTVAAEIPATQVSVKDKTDGGT